MSVRETKVETLSLEAYKALYEIIRVILRMPKTVSALQEIVQIARPVFIFDNIVLYELKSGQSLEPTYARSVGRGRSSGADMAWGETIAREITQKGEIVEKKLFVNDASDNRLNQQFYLGFPIKRNQELSGALVFIRFGGPPYLSEQIQLAGLISEQIEQLLERRYLVERVATLEAERQFDRLQEDFVAAVSHDLRTPLGFIKGYVTTLLREDAQWDAKTRIEFLSIIDDESDRLTELIDNLLDSSRLQAGILPIEPQAIQLDTLLRDFVQRVSSGKFNLSFHTEIDDSPCSIYIDAGRIIQVLDNLVVNAAKYAPGSTLTLNLKWEENLAHITLRDDGPGIAPEHIDDIFKRFFRIKNTDGKVQGTGLGLYICRQIIAAHDGKIFAESELGKGMVFHINLPCDNSFRESTSQIQETVI
ncbi:MAG: GAF domain-containing protein [Chloroflexi bacterium]|nr:GAF domain-containing protein [Chloroflexota bacterium]